MTELNSDAREEDPTLTGDLLEIYFMSDRVGGRDLWTSRRAALDAPWDPPRAVEELNTADAIEDTPCVSEDGLRIWFFSTRSPEGIWFAERARRDDPWGAPVHVGSLAVEGGVVMSLTSIHRSPAWWWASSPRTPTRTSRSRRASARRTTRARSFRSPGWTARATSTLHSCSIRAARSCSDQAARGGETCSGRGGPGSSWRSSLRSRSGSG